jgi:5-methylcytosine-specific restriction endonuclease McrA
MRTPKPIDWAAIAAAQPVEPYDWTPPEKSAGRPGGDQRGSTRNRRARKRWLLATFGDGEICPCSHCGAPLRFETMTADRIVPGRDGGRYVRTNIRPSCAPCANRQGADMTNQNRLDAPMELQ